MGDLKRLLVYAAPYWRGWIGIAAVTLLSTVFTLLQPWPLKILVDYVLGSAPMPDGLRTVTAWLPGTSSRVGLLGWVVGAGLLIFAADSAIDSVLTLAWTRLGRRVVYDVSSDLFARTQRKSLVFHGRHTVGDSLSRITGDAWSIYTLLDALLFAPGHAALSIAATVTVMVSLDPQMTLYAVAVVPFMTASAWLFGRPIREAAHRKRDIESRIQTHVQQTLRGIRVVQAFVREDLERKRFQEHAAEAIRAHQRGAFANSAYGLASGLTTTIGTAIVLWLAATRVLDGYLTIGSTLLFLSYLATLQTQLSTYTGIYTTMQSAGASIDRVVEALGEAELVRDAPGATPLAHAHGDVALEGVVFGYDPSSPVLKHVTFSARAGDTVAIVGQTGAGKSTLVSLLPRFFDPQQGRLLIDGQDLTSVRLQDLRRNISIVLQEPFLFPVSIADNIAYGRPSASRHEIEAAARTANAHRFIVRLPQGYDTLVGESGATLSGGERQRIAIARAVLKDAPILILDEPTSALDAETEQVLMQALTRLMEGRTTFVIAHRLSTVRRASTILVLDDGRIVEQGRHDDLLRRGGPYARLHTLSFGVGADASSAAGQ